MVTNLLADRCDNITISPALLGELEASTEALPRKLWPEMGGCDEPKIDMGADSVELFKKLHGEDEMAVQKLAEGIQGFSKDQASLEAMVCQALMQMWQQGVQ